MIKTHERKIDIAKMKMLRWSCGRTRCDRIRNEEIRKTIKVTEINKKIQERKLRWYGHIMRRDDNYPTKRAMEMLVEGRRRRGRLRKR